MEVVEYKDKLYLANIVKSNERDFDTSYNRTYDFYDYDAIKKLDGQKIEYKDLKKYLLFSEHITGTKLPFKRVGNLPPVKIEEEVVTYVTVKVGKPVTNYTFDE